MRFGKRLALAMIRDAGEAPYISQKELKHVLVGLEKLCKSFSTQTTLLADSNQTEADVIKFANDERVKYGLTTKNFIITVQEIVSRDAHLFEIMDSDIVRIRRYVESCESALMVMINDWLDEAESTGFLRSDVRSGTQQDIPSIDGPLKNELGEIQSEYTRIKQYIEVNIAGLRKLLNRRNKNVATECWSFKDYDNLYKIKSDETEMIGGLVSKLVDNFIN
jgi:hypothetical protein